MPGLSTISVVGKLLIATAITVSFLFGAMSRRIIFATKPAVLAILPVADFEEPEMVTVPAGSFVMGSPTGERGRGYDEGPSRTVTFAKPFAGGKYEVTFEQFDICSAEGGCRQIIDSDWRFRGELPAAELSWFDAKDYVKWLSAKTGKPYRLLTEAEWEYAARAGTTTAYHVGNDIELQHASFSDKFMNSTPRTSKVGSYPPNAFGLHDMHGNVMEWVEDCYRESFDGAPSDGSARVEKECTYRVLRGGAYHWVRHSVRSAHRYRYRPDVGNSNTGFRVALTLE